MNTSTATETLNIAQTILDQINASDFWARARWGVKQSLATETGLQMNCTKGIKIIVTLDPSDTYSIQVGRLVRKFDWSVKGEAEGIDADNLTRMIDGLFSKAFGAL